MSCDLEVQTSNPVNISYVHAGGKAAYIYLFSVQLIYGVIIFIISSCMNGTI